MSEQSSLASTKNEEKPTPEMVRKYNTEQLIQFLREKKENLQLDDDDCAILRNEKITGSVFFKLTKEEFMQVGMKLGPAKELVNFAKEIKGDEIQLGKEQIADAFPQGLPYLKPEPLLRTSGADWGYQCHPSLRDILRKALKDHYEKFILGRFDKTTIPLYLFLSGAGTGKSRNANEFHQTAITCLSAQEDMELLTRIKKAYVFLVSFENGTSILPKENPYLGIGTRMLFQLLRDKMDFFDIERKYNSPNPLEVVSLVAKRYNQSLKDVTVILVVDAMQQLMKSKDDGLKADSQFYETLSGIADLALKGTFLIPVCTSTISGQVENSLKHSPRNRVYLPIISLQPPYYHQGDKIAPVFNEDEVTNILVQDCGGHGRALEVLSDCLKGRDIEQCNLNTLMHELRFRLTNRYRDAIFDFTEYARPISRAILTRSRLNLYKTIPNTNKTPDELVGNGLIRFERINEDGPTGYLVAPYIWLWIFAEISHEQGDPILRDWEFTDYTEQRVLLDPVSSLHSKAWQSFEKFVALIRCIKSSIIKEDELTTMSEIHAGARLNGDIQFKNHNLRLEVAKHQTNTNSENYTASIWNVECQNSTIDVRQFRHCIVNAPSSPHGDAFLSLDQQNTKILNEVHQYKLMKKPITQEEYIQERKKSASRNDFFILFTTAENCNIKLPNQSGIVDGKVFNDYFGPFAGRAYKWVMPKSKKISKLNINNASFNQLCEMYRIGKKRANTIILTRPFENITDANIKTKIPINLLKNFCFRKGLHMISHIMP
ncbi:hypothetical protein Glove_240g37 [Diversispora epigaea]|uniref:SAM domain-containing protein n=1 Tax=Diversispora epigaea TaxID=1348612 RepID=A0A397II60_9GLOM|nr:hypothetical protein Glove_240g37 [Diversispora epigaea]